MCGIAGFIDWGNQSNEQQLEQMTAALVHRGPDGGNTHFEQLTAFQVGLGHRRLSIIDLSDRAKQPMQRQDNWLVFNGEVYNHVAIRNELIKEGYQFESDSDTEMILHAYRHWGIQCVEKFVGMFAFVLWDKKTNELYIVRDRAGVKPLFVYQVEGMLLFASELKSFHQHPGFIKKINHAAAAAFFQYGHVPTPHCIFENCHKVLPGHYLKVNLKSKEVRQVRYWNVYDAYNQPQIDISLEEAKHETIVRLKDACNLRMVSDVPVGVFLSGGYDSVAVTSILQSERKEPLKTFTISVPSIGLNEALYAKEIAAHLGTDHTEIECDVNQALDLIAKLPFYYDEPFGDSSAIPTMLVSKYAREKVTVALSADGGDELFAGYNRYDYLMRFHGKLNRVPHWIRRCIASTMRRIPADTIPIARSRYNFHNRYDKLRMLIQDPSPQRIMLSLSEQFTQESWNSLFQHVPAPLKTSYLSSELRQEHFSLLRYMMAIDYQTYMQDDILQKVDRATMSASLEGREPFMDHRLIEWAACLPDAYKYRSGVKKYILKEIVHQFVPQRMMDRPKMGFAIPLADWLMHPLKDLVHDVVSKDSITQQGILNWPVVEKVKVDFYSGRKENATKLWYFLMFQLWYQEWMEG
jgi:asparagine synthase (glutamine-hydrolysing)